MAPPRLIALAATCSLAIACFDGLDAKGLACSNDAQCGTELECVRALPTDAQGICGGETGPPVLDACGVAPRRSCQGVPPRQSRAFTLDRIDGQGTVGQNVAVSGLFVGNDDWEDLAVLNVYDNNVFLYRNDQNGGFVRIADPFVTVASSLDMLSADFDCDGNGDLVTVSFGEARLAFTHGTGNTIEPFDLANTQAAPECVSLAVADFDPQTLGPDLFVACNETSQLLFNQGQGAFEVPRNVANGMVPWSVATGDLDGDQIPDAVIANSDQDDYVDEQGNDYITIALSSQDFATTDYRTEALVNPVDVGILDLDSEPGADVVVLSKYVNGSLNYSSNPGTLSFHANDGTGDLRPMGDPITVATGAAALAIADFDCDGHDDIAIGHDVDPNLWILWGPEHSLAGRTEVETAAVTAARMEVVDLDHDGYPELVIPDFGTLDNEGLIVDEGGVVIVRSTP